MANKIVEGCPGDVSLFTSADFDTSTISDYDIVVLGSPACGSEEMDDTEFMPMFETIKDDLKDKKVFLFGSYGWGGGEFLQTFKEECENSGINISADPLIAENTPDDEAEALCTDFGKSLN